ncbi:peptidase inhibitor family I36 protein [Longimycelium tulufanense]|nr:peptidase inhibitor family I36 protein [Longimycelium tulufanense]
MALVMAAGGVTAAAAERPAAAPGAQETEVTAQPRPSCPRGWVCFWTKHGFRGHRGKVAGNNRNWQAFPERYCRSGTWDNCASSAYNNGRTHHVRFYQHPNYRGRGINIYKGQSRSSLGWMNDRTSSNKWFR